jgi:ribose 5-phosphate isomerase A
VPVLGKAFQLPVEVLPFGWQARRAPHRRHRLQATARQRDGKPFVTDNGNFVLDCQYDGIPDPAALARTLDALVGVVDHGLFVGMAGRVVVGDGRRRQGPTA